MAECGGDEECSSSEEENLDPRVQVKPECGMNWFWVCVQRNQRILHVESVQVDLGQDSRLKKHLYRSVKSRPLFAVTMRMISTVFQFPCRKNLSVWTLPRMKSTNLKLKLTWVLSVKKSTSLHHIKNCMLSWSSLLSVNQRPSVTVHREPSEIKSQTRSTPKQVWPDANTKLAKIQRQEQFKTNKGRQHHCKMSWNTSRKHWILFVQICSKNWRGSDGCRWDTHWRGLPGENVTTKMANKGKPGKAPGSFFLRGRMRLRGQARFIELFRWRWQNDVACSC